MEKKRKIVRRLFASALLTLSLYAVWQSLPWLLPCTEKATQMLALEGCGVLGFYLVLGGRRFWLVAGAVMVLFWALWQGTYPVKQPTTPLLTTFLVTTQTRGTFDLPQGAVLTLAAGKPTALQPLTAVAPLRCNWMSAQGGAFDDPQSCDTIYIAPQRESDIIKISVQPSCGLPSFVSQIKISILP